MRNRPAGSGPPVLTLLVRSRPNDFGPVLDHAARLTEVDADAETIIEGILTGQYCDPCGGSPHRRRGPGAETSPRTLPAPW
jgi:hypothetical protein